MNKCATCRHFGRNRTNNEQLYTDVAHCHGIPDSSRVGAPFSSPRRIQSGFLAATYDYEGYSSGIYVTPEFGCVLHEALSDA